MNRTRTIAIFAALTTLTLAACGPTFAERRAMLDEQWAITNARADAIHAEYERRIGQAQTKEERDAAIQWRMDELSKNFDDHRRRKGELYADWRDED